MDSKASDLVHLLEHLEVAGVDLGLEGRPDPEPHGELEARLRPREHPGDGAQRFDAARRSLRGARAEVEALEGRGLGFRQMALR